jgi:polyhydroxyalkanoate synthesis regulator phasin
MKKQVTPVHITGLEIENVKRVKAVHMEPAETGLTVIGGDNRQGKTSVLDAIMAALGGEKFTPSNAVRDGADKGQVTVTLSNGLVVTRSFTGKGSYLKVADPAGSKGGQMLLNEFVSEFALSLGKFLGASDKEKTKTLLQIIGVDLTPFEERHKKLYGEREQTGRLRDRAKHHAEAMPYNEAVGTDILTPSDIMAELEAKVGKNAKNREIRTKAEAFRANLQRQEGRVRDAKEAVADLEKRIQEAKAELGGRMAELDRMRGEVEAAQKAAAAVQDEDVTAIKTRLAQIEDTNAEVRKNLDREKALAEAEGFGEEYRALSHQIEANQTEMRDLLNGAAMPLEGLSVDGGVLTFAGAAWDCMSGADQLRVATAIVRKLNPACGFVLIDKVEQMDLTTLREFAAWLQAEGLQAITTRVSRGDECSIVIEAGEVAEASAAPEKELSFA